MANYMTGFEYKHLETVEDRYWHSREFLRKNPKCNFSLQYKRIFRVQDGFSSVWKFGVTKGLISLEEVLQAIMTVGYNNCVISRNIFNKNQTK